MSTAIRRLVIQLEDLTAGSRAWFWFCPEAAAPLLISPLSEDPGMRALSARSRRVARPAGSTPLIGICSIAEDGRLDFGAPGATRQTLADLAAWSVAQFARYPGLGILRDSRVHELDARFAVLRTFEDADLWDGLSGVTPAGTTSWAAEELASLQAGEKAWFWLTRRGPDTRPYLTVSRVQDDPDAGRLRAQIKSAIRRSPKATGSIRGVVTADHDGTLRVVSKAPDRVLTAALRSLSRAHNNPTLSRLIAA